MNFYPFHIGDYAVHTRYLTPMEDLAYRRLLDLYYTNEGPIAPLHPAHDIGLAEHEGAVAKVLSRFFVETPEGWRNERCDEEIGKYKRMGEGGKLGATRRWAKLKGGDSPPIPLPNASPMPTKNQEPRTNKEKARKRATSLPADFLIADRVREWAREKGFSPSECQANFEAFVSYAKRKGATYVDWDEALMTAIRDDWAKTRAGKGAANDVFAGAI